MNDISNMNRIDTNSPEARSVTWWIDDIATKQQEVIFDQLFSSIIEKMKNNYLMWLICVPIYYHTINDDMYKEWLNLKCNSRDFYTRNDDGYQKL